MVTMSAHHVQSRGDGQSEVGTTDPPDSLRAVPFLDTSRATHFAECLVGLRVSRVRREASTAGIRGKLAAGTALTDGESALLDVDTRCVVELAGRAALREIEQAETIVDGWHHRKFRDDPRFGDAVLESCRGRVASAKHTCAHAVATAQPAIAEAKRVALEQERAELEQRLAASKRRQRETRFAFDADIAAARRNETVKVELVREHAKELSQKRELDKRREVHGVLGKGRALEAVEVGQPVEVEARSRALKPEAPTTANVHDVSDASRRHFSDSSSFMDDTNEFEQSNDMEDKRLAWNQELDRRRVLLEEERLAELSGQPQKPSAPVTHARSGFLIPAERRQHVLAVLWNHALSVSGGKSCGTEEERKVPPEVVATALVAAESGARVGDDALGAERAVAISAAKAVLRAIPFSDPDAPVPYSFCYGRGADAGPSTSIPTYMTSSFDLESLTENDALCAYRELRDAQSVFGNATFTETFAYFRRLGGAQPSDTHAVSVSFAKLVVPRVALGGGDETFTAAVNKFAKLARALWRLDDLSVTPPKTYAPFWASKTTKARVVKESIAEKAKASRPISSPSVLSSPGVPQKPTDDSGTHETVPTAEPAAPPLAGLLGDLGLGPDDLPDSTKSTNLFTNRPSAAGPRVSTARPSSAKLGLGLNLSSSSAFASAKRQTAESGDLDASDDLEAALRALPSPTARKIMGPETTAAETAETKREDTVSKEASSQPEVKPVPSAVVSNPPRNPPVAYGKDSDEFDLTDSSEFDFTAPSPEAEEPKEHEKPKANPPQNQAAGAYSDEFADEDSSEFDFTEKPKKTEPRNPVGGAYSDEFDLEDSSEFDFAAPSPEQQKGLEHEKESATRPPRLETANNRVAGMTEKKKPAPEPVTRPVPGGPRRRPGGGSNPPARGITPRPVAEDSDSSMSDFVSRLGRGTGGVGGLDESDSFDF